MGLSADVYFCANDFVVYFFVRAGCLRRVTVLLLCGCQNMSDCDLFVDLLLLSKGRGLLVDNRGVSRETQTVLRVALSGQNGQ